MRFILLTLLLAGCAADVKATKSQCVPEIPYSQAFLDAAAAEMPTVRAQAPHVGIMVDDYHSQRRQEEACAKASVPKS